MVVTDVPSIEPAKNFEDLLHDPKIIFKGQAGVEKSLEAKAIKKLGGNPVSPPTSMDRARDLVRTRIANNNNPQTSTLRSQTLVTTQQNTNNFNNLQVCCFLRKYNP